MLTPAQLAVLKADIAADPVLSLLPKNGDSAFSVAAEYNKLASPAFAVWRSEAPVSAIFDAITWDKYTPTDAPDGTATYTNRILSVQTKQMNLQNMLVGKATIDATKANIRVGLRDAVIALPTGVAGAATTAGGVSGATVLTACQRAATRAEKLFSTGTATTGATVGALMGFEGALSGQDITQAWES